MRAPNFQAISRNSSEKGKNMTLRTLLTGIIPVLSAAMDKGVYQDSLRERAIDWASQVGTACMLEGRDGADATMALMALGRADGFEMQQLGLTASFGLCDDLLCREAANVPPDFAPARPERTVAEILADIETSTREACNVYAIASERRLAMIGTGAELEKAVSRDVAAGIRTGDDAAAARSVHEAVAEVATCPIRRRSDEAERTLAAIARLAA
jgi:hypothetical protein